MNSISGSSVMLCTTIFQFLTLSGLPMIRGITFPRRHQDFMRLCDTSDFEEPCTIVQIKDSQCYASPFQDQTSSVDPPNDDSWSCILYSDNKCTQSITTITGPVSFNLSDPRNDHVNSFQCQESDPISASPSSTIASDIASTSPSPNLSRRKQMSGT
ncbi:hypothetical protein MVEN_00031900 [Mycena venus]|uniref:Uncharacterized protein n=1 Tax=Mycena venus TaxID=2733690 RepID=A0A8H6Z3Q1_9AGAR|nr:hypothetical protein MVEN_00031900 [Mycena venus]